jgi:hypothetical protein
MSAMMRTGLAILVCLPMVLLIATLWRAGLNRTPLHDVAYADAVFGDVLPFTSILASRQDVYLGLPTKLVCDFAVVRTVQQAAHMPPKPDFTRLDRTQFGGLWQPSPGIVSLTALPSPLDHCQDVMFPGVADALRIALELQGSWVAYDPLRRTMHIYAPAAQVAARIGVRR